MELAKSFDPASIEQRWYREWESNGYFKPRAGNSTRFAIALPPPNVTGTLHMGHAFQHTLMDILIRYHRMLGHETLWQPGTDHAGIATQIVVERQLELQGRSRAELGREAFVERIWQWKEESGSTITRQMRRLGASADWSRERFTMDEGLSRAVTEVFVALHREGLIYRGKRLVNWDPILHTAVSDLEVASHEEDGFIWHIRYPLEDGSGYLTVATTRPETMLGDVAVAVNPDDPRYAKYVGQNVRLPLCDRLIPVIADEHVDAAFGSGCLKITPAHDFNDYAIGMRHRLQQINIFTLDARINEDAPPVYRGLDRYEARKRIVADLDALGLLEATKPHKLMVPRGERSHVVIEPMLTDQWYVATRALADQALAAVAHKHTRFVPENWATTYNQWLDNIQDWCISRQLWWGHRIPAWYDDEGNVYVAKNETEARAQAAGRELNQDPDVLDTWFSSALWPFSTLGWPDKTVEMEKFLPTSVLVTGFDIIFFWVARMMMMGLHFTKKVPFHDVYVTGLVRDAEGQKMSKSKGNVLDPLDLIDGIGIEELVAKRTTNLMDPRQAPAIERQTRKQYPNGIPSFGTDALRFTLASLATHGRDIKFDLNRCEGYRNFCNKLWNATRFVLMNTEGQDVGLDQSLPLEYGFVDRWIIGRLQEAEAEVVRSLENYRFDLAARAIYEFVWDEYCDWYVELAKVRLAQGGPDAQRATRRTMVRVLETALRLAHPIIPFISEELWHKIAPLAGNSGATIMLAPYPKADLSKCDAAANALSATLKDLVNACRGLRSQLKLSPAQKIPLHAQGDRTTLAALEPYLVFLARLSSMHIVEDALPAGDAPVEVVGAFRLMLEVEIDREAEQTRMQKDIARWEQEVAKAKAKLATPSFIERAPAAVVEQEKKRLIEAEATLADIKAEWQAKFAA